MGSLLLAGESRDCVPIVGDRWCGAVRILDTAQVGSTGSWLAAEIRQTQHTRGSWFDERSLSAGA